MLKKIVSATLILAGSTLLAQSTKVSQVTPCEQKQNSDTEVYCLANPSVVPSSYTIKVLAPTVNHPKFQIGVLADYNLTDFGKDANLGGPTFTHVGHGEYNDYGFGAYIDADVSKHFGVEAEGRVNHAGVNEDSAAIGPRVHVQLGKFSPYAKVLGGASIFSGRSDTVNRNDGAHYMVAYGVGTDYAVLKHVNLRAEVQYQSLFEYSGVHAYHNDVTVSPIQYSTGIAYRF